MITQTTAIARNTFVESLRQPVMLLMILGAGALQVFNTWNTGFTMGLDEVGEVEADNKLLLDIGLGTVFGLATVLAAFVATAALSREIENKTALTVVSKPVPRPVVVLGKYLGVTGAILIAVVAMLCFLLMAIRHGVMSTAADSLDQPVLVFGFAAVVLALLFAGWTNFFYGWSFPQVATVTLTPLLVVAYIAVLLVNKKWEVQDVFHDFKPQIILASIALATGTLVLTSIAIAASARLGQVMTIFVCIGAFLASLVNNYFIGRHVFKNTPIGQVVSAEPGSPNGADFARPGETYFVQLRQPPDKPLQPGDSIWYGINSDGFDSAVPRYTQYRGDLSVAEQVVGPSVSPALVVRSAEGARVTLLHVGGEPLDIRRPPREKDYIFTTPTHVNWGAMVAWGALPNMQYFWLLDAVTQNHIVPLDYVGYAAVYALAQIIGYLALAVILFQKRDVG